MPNNEKLVKKSRAKLNGILEYWSDGYSPGIKIVDPVVLRVSRS